MALIRLDRARFFHNLSVLADKAGGKERLAVVLKDNAYGHGLEEMARLAEDFGIAQAVVINQEEADRIKARFENVLILHDTPRADPRCSYAITELAQLNSAPKGAKLELKVDTGMHRNGILHEELEAALSIVRKRGLHLFGVMSHYRSADELGSGYFWQRERFRGVRERVREAGFANVRFHSHNSAGLLRCNDFDEEIARVGIAIYGFDPREAEFERADLRPVLSLWARRSSSRTLRAGERIGYGGEFVAERPMRVSTYDLGYGDGWFRGDARRPFVTAEGLPILGRVSMDFLSLEGEKEEVCIFDDARTAARHFGTICYEITTALAPSIQRIIV